jgi:hypothetical protein
MVVVVEAGRLLSGSLLTFLNVGESASLPPHRLPLVLRFRMRSTSCAGLFASY